MMYLLCKLKYTCIIVIYVFIIGVYHRCHRYRHFHFIITTTIIIPQQNCEVMLIIAIQRILLLLVLIQLFFQQVKRSSAKIREGSLRVLTDLTRSAIAIWNLPDTYKRTHRVHFGITSKQ